MRKESFEAGRPLPKLVLLRHGLSVANEGKAFGGWDDVELSDAGIKQARAAGLSLKQAGITFDLAFTSVLRRAVCTLSQCQLALGSSYIPTVQDWRLNERHFGELQGMSKSDAEAHYGARQVAHWRKDFYAKPPPLAEADLRDPFGTSLYQHLSRSEAPLTESMADTYARVRCVFSDALLPALIKGLNILVVAHGNSIRALLLELERIDPRNLSSVEVGNAVPLIYHFRRDSNSFLRQDVTFQRQEGLLHEVLPAAW